MSLRHPAYKNGICTLDHVFVEAQPSSVILYVGLGQLIGSYGVHGLQFDLTAPSYISCVDVIITLSKINNVESS